MTGNVRVIFLLLFILFFLHTSWECCGYSLL